MKKKIIIGVFCTIIFATIVYSIVGAIQSYHYDIENNVDILEGFGGVLVLMVGGYVVFYELDLFYTVYYFLTKPTSVVKSTLNILSNLSLFMIVLSTLFPELFRVIAKPFMALFQNEDGLVLLLFIFTYIVFRVSYGIVCAINKGKSRNL